MISMSISSSLRPMFGENFPPTIALKVHTTLSPLISQDQTFVLAGFAFSPSLETFKGHHHQVMTISYVCSRKALCLTYVNSWSEALYRRILRSLTVVFPI